MGKIGKISPIIKDVTGAYATMDTSLRLKGFTRYPGTYKHMFPYRELNGVWRTGLDENAQYIKALERVNKTAALAEKERVIALRKELEQLSGYDLAPDSKYWKDAPSVRLIDGDNLFDLEQPDRAIAYAWLRVHPQIAPSLRAWEAGEVPSDLAYYVKDDNAEAVQAYKKDKAVNDAILKFTSFSNEKRIKISRLMGLPVSGDEIEEVIYTYFTKAIRSSEMKDGPYKGASPVRIFERFATVDDEKIDTFNLVELALRGNIYRTGTGGKIYEGETVVFNNKEEMQDFFLSPANQDQLILLKKRVDTKKVLV